MKIHDPTQLRLCRRIPALTFYLVIREDLHGLVLDPRHSPHSVRTFARLGAVTSLHAGGAGKILLAYAPPEVVEQFLSRPLERHTDTTITDPSALRAVLEQIRHDQFHMCLSDLQEHVFALAVPIFGHQGEVVAALSIAGPTLRFGEERLAHYSALLRQAGEDVSARLGAPSS